MKRVIALCFAAYVKQTMGEEEVDTDWQSWDKDEKADIYDAETLNKKLVDGYRQYANTYNITIDPDTEYQLRVLGNSISELANSGREAEEKYQANKKAFDRALDKTWGKIEGGISEGFSFSQRKTALPPIANLKNRFDLPPVAKPALSLIEGEAAATEPATTEPAATEPATTEPAATETTTTTEEPVATETTTTEKPAKTEEPASDETTHDKPAEEQPAEEQPTEEKPTEEKPTEEKPTEEKPTEEKPTQDKPAETPEEEKTAEEKEKEQAELEKELERQEQERKELEGIDDTLIYIIASLVILGGIGFAAFQYKKRRDQQNERDNYQQV